MTIALRIALGGLGVLFLLIGLQFLTDPVNMGGDFGLTPNGNGGLSTIRADMTAFFWVSGGALLLGVWKRRGGYCLIPAALVGITLAGRCLSLAIDGPYDGWMELIAVEAVTVILCLAGWRIVRPD